MFFVSILKGTPTIRAPINKINTKAVDFFIWVVSPLICASCMNLIESLTSY